MPEPLRIVMADDNYVAFLRTNRIGRGPTADRLDLL